jgi:hypothetical protein
MKKFFAMFALAGALVSCNDSSTTTTNPDSTNLSGDSLNVTPNTGSDSLNTVPPANLDSLNRVDTTHAIDSAHR